MTSRGLRQALLLLPLWAIASAMIWMFIGFAVPGAFDYSSAMWSFVNYGLPAILLLSYLVVARRLIRREDV